METLGAPKLFPMGEAWEEDPVFEGLEGLFFALLTEEWTFMLWKEYKEIETWRDKTVPSRIDALESHDLHDEAVER